MIRHANGGHLARLLYEAITLRTPVDTRHNFDTIGIKSLVSENERERVRLFELGMKFKGLIRYTYIIFFNYDQFVINRNVESFTKIHLTRA